MRYLFVQFFFSNKIQTHGSSFLQPKSFTFGKYSIIFFLETSINIIPVTNDGVSLVV